MYSSSCSTRMNISRFSELTCSSFFIRLFVRSSSSRSTALCASRCLSLSDFISAAYAPARARSRVASSFAASSWRRSSTTSSGASSEDAMARERVARVELAPKERARSVFFSSLLQSDADEKYPFVGLIELFGGHRITISRDY